MKLLEQLSQKSFMELYESQKDNFEKHEYENEHDKFSVAKSKGSCEICGAFFYVRLSFFNDKLRRVMLVADRMQTNEIYKEKELGEMHKTWLVNNLGNPTREEAYGLVYCCDGIEISSEYDPRSSSEDIIIDYK